jgi:hypothetical protein
MARRRRGAGVTRTGDQQRLMVDECGRNNRRAHSGVMGVAACLRPAIQ